MLSMLSPCDFFTTTVLIGALIVEYLFFSCANFCTNRLMGQLRFIDSWFVSDSMRGEPVAWSCYRSRVIRLQDDFLSLVRPVLDSPDVSASLPSVKFEVVIKDNR